MSNIKYRRDIDGLRAIAILPVLLYHAGIAGFSGGFIGVDVFFVISGYLITAIIAREVSEGRFSFANFWARRARRILPASVAVMVCSLIAGWFLLAPSDYIDLGRSARDQAYFAGNIYFWKEAGYFDGPSELKPLLHTWSLAVEEQFYMVFPLVFLLCHKYLPKAKVSLFIVIFLASLLASMYFIKAHPSATFYLLHARAWELLVGGLLALAPLGGKHNSRLCEWVSLAGLAIIAYCVVSYDSSTLFPGLAALPPTLATAAIIWANSYHNTFVKRLLSIAPLVWIGLISYSLYLWHWPLMAFVRYSSVGELVLIDKLSLVAVSMLLGYLSWRFVETPFRTRQLLGSNKKILSGAFAALLVVIMAGQQIRSTQGYPPRLPEQALNFAMAANWKNYQKQCYRLDPEDIEEGRLCRFGDEQQAKPELFFWGDSHASALVPAIKNKAEEYGVLTLHAAKSGCPPIVGAERLDDPSCSVFNRAMTEQLEQRQIKHVLLAGRWSAYIYGAKADSPHAILSKKPAADKDPEDAKQIFRSYLTDMVKDLRAKGITVWLVRQVPWQQNINGAHDLTRLAMNRIDTGGLGIPFHVHRERQAFVNSVLNELAGDGVVILDPAPLMCADQFCPVQNDGHSYYRDDSHLSVYGATMIEDLFDPLFTQIRGHAGAAKLATGEALFAD